MQARPIKRRTTRTSSTTTPTPAGVAATDPATWLRALLNDAVSRRPHYRPERGGPSSNGFCRSLSSSSRASLLRRRASGGAASVGRHLAQGLIILVVAGLRLKRPLLCCRSSAGSFLLIWRASAPSTVRRSDSAELQPPGTTARPLASAVIPSYPYAVAVPIRYSLSEKRIPRSLPSGGVNAVAVEEPAPGSRCGAGQGHPDLA